MSLKSITASMVLFVISVLCAAVARADYYTATCSCHKQGAAFSCDFDLPVNADDPNSLAAQCLGKSHYARLTTPATIVAGELGGWGPLPERQSVVPWPFENTCVKELDKVVIESYPRGLFGEQTGWVKSCIVAPPDVHFSKLFCYMNKGKSGDAPPVGQIYKTAKSCTKFWTTDGCVEGWAAVAWAPDAYIGKGGELVVCMTASAEKGTGDRYWGIIGGD